MWLSTVWGYSVTCGNPLTSAKLALDDHIVPYFFVRIVRIDLFD